MLRSKVFVQLVRSTRTWSSSVPHIKSRFVVRSFSTCLPKFNIQCDISTKQYGKVYASDPLDASRPLDTFARRHLGPSPDNVNQMLKKMGYNDLDSFIGSVIPPNVLKMRPLKFKSSPKGGFTEHEMIENLTQLGEKNKYKVKNLIGKGYYGTLLPPVIQRNLLESPEWYTSYTPYQPEISQGRLESLLNFQTVVSDLTGLPIANASLLDEGTAAAEAMLLAFHLSKKKKTKFIIDDNTHSQTKSVLRTRANPVSYTHLDVYKRQHYNILFIIYN